MTIEEMFLPKLNTAYLAIFAGDILMLIAGTSFSWSSPIVPKLLNNSTSPFGRSLSTEEVTWISSLVPLGAAIGPFVFGYMADKIGRKYSLLSLGVPLIASHLTLALGKIVELYYVARFIIGLCVGGIFTIMPNYAAEIADKSVRGVLGSTLSIAVGAGVLLSYSLGPYASILWFNLALAIIPAIFLVIFFFVGVECPHYYISKGNSNLARTILRQIRGGDKNGDTEKELIEIQSKINEEGKGTILDIIKSKGLIKAMIIAAGLLIIQQFTGISLILYYNQTLFQETGASLPPEICSIIVGAVQFISSFTTPLVIDRLGRKITLMASAIGMILTEVPLGVYIYLKDEGVEMEYVSFLPILALTVFILVYNSGFGPLPWIMLGEVFPSKVKVIASSVISCISWSVSFILTKYFDSFINFGLAQSFWLFACCCLVGFLFSKFVVIETKGKSLEEIQDILNS